jgi:magnesium chelatase family protein
MDRIDMWIEVAEVDHEKLAEKKSGEDSDTVQKRVKAARDIQADRFKDLRFSKNSDMASGDIDAHIDLNNDLKKLLIQSANQLDLSARAHHKTIKLARTIADLEQSDNIKEDHLLEALQYRSRDSLE